MTGPIPIDAAASSEEIVGLWNRRLGSTFPLDERLLLQQLGMERGNSLCLGVRESPGLGTKAGRLLGAALVKEEAGGTGRGRLSFIVVDEAASRRGLGSALLAGAERWLADRGVERLALGGDKYHFFPGQPLDGSPASIALGAFLDERGFEVLEGPVEEDVVADLGALDMAAMAVRAPLAEGYACVPYDGSLHGAIEDFLAAEFPGRWRSDTMEALDAGMRDRDLALLVEKSTRAIAGFARIYDKESPILGPGVYWRALMGRDPGGLGPIGVASSARGKGLGLALLRLCMEALALRGVRTMVIDWTDIGAFYAKLGFAPWKAYRGREKAIRLA
jgi:GNAT superfamily N-acetyltransferase